MVFFLSKTFCFHLSFTFSFSSSYSSPKTWNTISPAPQTFTSGLPPSRWTPSHPLDPPPPPLDLHPQRWTTIRWTTLRRTVPKFRSFFFSKCERHTFHSSLPLLGVLSLNSAWCFWRPGPWNVHVWALARRLLGLPGLSHDNPRHSKLCSGPRRFKHHQNQRKDPQKRVLCKNDDIVAGGEEEARNCGPPPPFGPHPSVPTPSKPPPFGRTPKRGREESLIVAGGEKSAVNCGPPPHPSAPTLRPPPFGPPPFGAPLFGAPFRGSTLRDATTLWEPTLVVPKFNIQKLAEVEVGRSRQLARTRKKKLAEVEIGRSRSRSAPKGGGAQIFGLLFPSPALIFVRDSFSLWGSSRGIFGGRFCQRRGPQMLHVWSSWAVVWNPGGTKIPREDPQEREEKRKKTVAGCSGKKERIFGSLSLCPTQAPPFVGTTTVIPCHTSASRKIDKNESPVNMKKLMFWAAYFTVDVSNVSHEIQHDLMCLTAKLFHSTKSLVLQWPKMKTKRLCGYPTSKTSSTEKRLHKMHTYAVVHIVIPQQGSQVEIFPRHSRLVLSTLTWHDSQKLSMLQSVSWSHVPEIVECFRHTERATNPKCAHMVHLDERVWSLETTLCPILEGLSWPSWGPTTRWWDAGSILAAASQLTSKMVFCHIRRRSVKRLLVLADQLFRIE